MQLALQGNSRAGFREDIPLAVTAALYWGVVLLVPTRLLGPAGLAVWTAQGLILLVFALQHGVRRYGWDAMLMWGGITFLISWSTESLSMATGFPFGYYHYTALLGAQIGGVPLAIMPAYFVAGYLAWTMGTVFVGNLGRGVEARNLLRLPLTASLLMVLWDLCLDPIKATIEGAWIWEDGGAYWGVPVSNFLGWYLTTYLIFQAFALYLYQTGSHGRFEQKKAYWYLVPAMYLGLALEYLLYPLWKTTDLDIYRSVFVVALLTMVFASVLNLIHIKRGGAR